ncbi:MAG TPA: hypothetical protein G4N93_03720 [Dehalococcoidia bacterium]|nr:hypothetical protein [Dehalococcoidia bacterium]
MKLSDVFTKWLPSALTFIFMGISLAIFIFALKIASIALIAIGVVGLNISDVIRQ